LEKKCDYNGRWEANRKRESRPRNETNENHPRWARDGAKPVGPAGDDRVVDDRLLAVEDDPTNKSEILHPLEDVRQVGEFLDFVCRLDFASSSDINSFDGVLPVTDVGSFDLELLKDSEEDINLDLTVGWQTNTNEHTLRSEVIESLLVSLGS